MNMVMTQFSRLEKLISSHRNYFLIVAILLFLVYLISISATHILRWDLNEPLAIGIRWIQGLSFYPDPQEKWLMEIGFYFPGIALVVSGFASMGIEMPTLQLVMMLLACIVFLLFVFTQHLTVKVYHKNATNHGFFMFALLFYILSADKYLFYAVEFKPDTIALLFGVSGVLLRLSKKGILNGICAGILIGLPIIFKQQYLGFFIPVVVCFLIRRDFLVCVIAVVAFIGTLTALGQIEHIWSYTVFRFSDRLFNSIRDIAHFHTTLLIGFFPLMLFIFWNGSMKKILREAIAFVLRKEAYFDPLFMGLLGAAAGSYSTILIDGSNGGNVTLAYACMLPYFWILFRKYISARVSYVSIAVLCFLLVHSIPRAIRYFDNFEQLKVAYSEAVGSDSHVLITNSNYYTVYANSNRIYINTADMDKKTASEKVMELAKQGDKPIYMLGNLLPLDTFKGRVGEKLFGNDLGVLIKF
jgi:hypothetical protein